VIYRHAVVLALAGDEKAAAARLVEALDSGASAEVARSDADLQKVLTRPEVQEALRRIR